ncbi:hypothetical protein FGRMN_9893 [Fusarium graminum]|nr:hypothetical protein FGRMN_9893 [Fusarium graminum]
MARNRTPRLPAKATSQVRRQYEQNNTERTTVSKQLIIDQANFMGSGSRETSFLKFQDDEAWQTPDVIVGCDSSSTTPWKSPGDYYLEMKPIRMLVETDNPNDPNRPRDKPPKRRGRKPKNPPLQADAFDHPPAEEGPVPMARVFFLIHKSIPKETWNVQWHEGDNSEMLATLHLATEVGDLRIHSAYNPNQPPMTMTIPDMVEKTTKSGRDIVMGDFNLHDPSWAGPLFRGDASKVTAPARALKEGMANANMALATPPGSETFRRKDGDDILVSCLDLCFVSQSLKDCVKSCQVYEQSPWPDSDHRPVRTILDIEAIRDSSLRYLYDQTDVQRFNKALARELPPLDLLKAIDLDQEQVEKLARVVISGLQTAVDTTVPTRLANPRPSARPLDLKALEILEGDGVAPTLPGTIAPSGTPEDVQTPANLRTQRRRAKRAAKKKKTAESDRHFIHNLGESTNGTWKVARLGLLRTKPRIMLNMPDLKDPLDNVYTTETEKQQHLLRALWKRIDELEYMVTVPFPALKPDRKELFMDMSVEEKEVRYLIKNLRRKKAPGTDMVANEAIKLGIDTLIPYLTILFRHCLELSYFPAAFKIALTVMLPKPNKESYASAKS